MRVLTNIARLVLFENGVGKLLVDEDIVVPVLLFLTAVCGLVPEEVMEQWPKHFVSICKCKKRRGSGDRGQEGGQKSIRIERLEKREI